MMRIMILVMMLSVMVSGCAEHTALNDAIMENNRLTRIAYADGMAGCGEDAACKVGVTAAYFSGAGQQELVKPETAKDYLQAGLPYANLALTAFGLYWNGSGNGTSGDRASVYIKGDGNTLAMGNKLSAADYSATAMDLTPSYARSYDGGYNRTYTGAQQPISDAGLGGAVQ